MQGVGSAVGLLSQDMDSPMKTTGNTTKTIPSFRKLSSMTLRNYFSALMKFVALSRRID